MIVKIYNLQRSATKRLIGYVKVNPHFDFDKKLVPGKEKKFTKEPNEHFYRKVRKTLNIKWHPNLAFKELSPVEIDEILASYARQINFITKQENHLRTLISTSK